ncbi:hypothetical protein [Silvanigrella aquatica]|uniref:Uncharacterized protein n=1 Tax=Silvanigrella aquatica TaxID=1915309 RepID=A0A1L4CXQ5_9BACT|nr:hypothetical protein [Silvanigrella aquatica]APJ02741.1 hypothetical protein AXG55_01890 [Silvanigrella aquatica]
MNTGTNSLKKNIRKFNLIFFIDHEKTYHFKIHLVLVKIIFSFMVILVVSSIVSIFYSISVFKKSQDQEKYIIGFKQELLKSYFENYIFKEDKRKDNEFSRSEVSKPEAMNKNSIVKNESDKLQQTGTDFEKDDNVKLDSDKSNLNNKSTKEDILKLDQTKKIPIPNEVAKVEPAKPTVPNAENSKTEPVVRIIENSAIKIENPKISQENDTTKISFSLSNTNSEKNSISGKVCAVIFATNEKGENIIYKIPQTIVLNSQNIPLSCKEGEQVRFSRLRPTEFIINKGKSSLNIKKVNIFFSNGDDKGIILNSF